MEKTAVIQEALKRVSYLRGLSESERQSLASALTVNRLQPGTTLFREGQPGGSVHIVVVGQLSVSLSTLGGEHTVASILPGDTVGEMACVDPGSRSASVTAQKPSITLELDRSTLKALYSHMPRTAVAITTGVINVLTQRIRATNQRIAKELETRRHRAEPALPKSNAELRLRATTHQGRIDLRRVPCLQSFTDEQLQTLLRIAPPRTYGPGTVLCREGSVADSCFIIAQGEVEVFHRTDTGPRVLATLPMGSLVGQMALVDEAPRSASVRTTETSIILALKRDIFLQLLKSTDPLGVKFQEQIAIAGIRQLRAATAQLKTLLQRPVDKSIRHSSQLTPQLRHKPQAAFLPKPGIEGAAEHRAMEPRSRAAAEPLRKPKQPRMQSNTGPIHPALLKKRTHGQSEDDRYEDMLNFMQTALDDWDMEVDQLDNMKVARATGELSASERSARAKK
ncbi:MAG: cyclic nucleotide-binding domain-containing protein [Myxococcota bacterium]|nr:cyclic nucleotide-binding domain-containing protein [Myxococcota bacterium]